MIRKYIESDVDGIIAAWYSASKVAHPFLDMEFLKKEEQNIRSVYLPNTETWVYEVNNEVIGFIALMGNEVGAIFLDPDYHGNGIGYQLMNFVSKFHDVLEVEVFKKNSIGRTFYERFGFTFLSEGFHEDSNCETLRLRYTKKNRD